MTTGIYMRILLGAYVRPTGVLNNRHVPKLILIWNAKHSIRILQREKNREENQKRKPMDTIGSKH
jgi:hypothetical protein